MNKEELKPHPHADVLIAFANGGVIEYKAIPAHPGGREWFCPENNEMNPISCPNILWRIKPKTHWINGIECPAPLKALPQDGSPVFVADPSTPDFYYELPVESLHAGRLLKLGLAHSTQEAAIDNAQAMLAFKDTP